MKLCLAYALYLFCMLPPVIAVAQQDSFSVYFSIGNSKLSDVMQAKLDTLFLDEKIQGARTIAIYGYADEPGSNALNHHLSAGRAAAVRSYLLRGGVKPTQIKVCDGRGHVSGMGVNAADRRADILINRVLAPVAADTGIASHRVVSPGIAELDKLEEGQAMEIDSLLFVQGTSAIIPSSNAVLQQLADILAANPNMHVRLEGHICCMTVSTIKPGAGSNNVPERLSEQRAMAVYDYLVSHGISATRLSYRGMGSSHPKRSPERTEEDRQANRRVEVRVLSK